jgi:hypothetical protein
VPALETPAETAAEEEVSSKEEPTAEEGRTDG